MADKKQHDVAREEPSFVFDKCCWCIPLKTGCLILAYLQLIYVILYGIYFAINLEFGIELLNHSEERYRKMAGTILTVSTLVLLIALITLSFHITLLVGLHKEKRKLIRVYIIVGTVSTVVSMMALFGSVVFGTSFNCVTLSLLHIAFKIYLLLLLRSHYIKMGKAEGLPSYGQDGNQIIYTIKV